MPFFFPADSLTPGANFAQDDQVPGEWGTWLMSIPISAMIDRGGDLPDASDLIQPFRLVPERGDHLLDPGVQLGDVGVDRIDTGQHLGQQERMVIGEVPGERLLAGR